MKVLLSPDQLQKKISELADALIKNHTALNEILFIGIQQGGVEVADQIIAAIKEKKPKGKIMYGQLDITFYRDDIRKKILAPDTMNIPFNIENKQIILIDDVLFTGRTIKAALDALLDYGRPVKVELCVLIDRKEHRQFPIQPDYTGMVIQTKKEDKVKLTKDRKDQNQVVLITQ
jgi:pyrimidine operon attenuation protein/uracil phosphoribosyltransferase